MNNNNQIPNSNNNSIISIAPSNNTVNNFKEEIEEDDVDLEKIKDQENNKMVFEIDDSDITEDEEESDEEAEELRVLGNESREVVLTDDALKGINKNKNGIVVEKLQDSLSGTNNNEIIGVNEEEFTLENEGNQNVNYSDLLKKESVEINTEVYINEEQKIFEDDFTYVIELQRELLKTLPVTKQGLLYVQKGIEREVKKIIEVKNLAVENNIKRERGIEYDYNKPWIIPIVLDKHKIYAKIKEDELEDNSDEVKINNNNEEDVNMNVFFTDSQEDELGIEKVNQINQLKSLKNIHHLSMLKDKISFIDYVNEFNNITKPYLWKKELGSGIEIEKNEIGYFVHYQNNTLL